MTIKIDFTTGGPDDALDAAGLIAFLVTRYPDAAEQAIERVTGPVEVTGGPIDLSKIEDGLRAMHRAYAPVVEKLAGAGAPMPAEAGAPLPDAPVTTEAATSADPLPMTPEQAFGTSASSATVAAPTATTTASAAPATAPAAPTATPTGAAPELDAEGLPWDERIHSSNHKKSANGVWMKRRGVAPAIDQTVRAELRQTYPEQTAAQRTMQAAVAEGLIPRPPVPAAPVPAAPTPVPVSTPPAAAPTTAVSPVTPQPTPSDSTPVDGAKSGTLIPAPPIASPSETYDVAFARIMKLVAGPGGYQERGVVTQAETLEICGNLGLTNKQGEPALSAMLAPANHDKILKFEAAVVALAQSKGG